MPIFRTTDNILKDTGEYFDPNWMDSDKVILPPKQDWDYGKEMQIEDVDIWEVLVESGGFGVFAAWQPYAEFYMVKFPDHSKIETFYGKGAQKRLVKFLKILNINLPVHSIWVNNDKMWLYVDDKD